MRRRQATGKAIEARPSRELAFAYEDAGVLELAARDGQSGFNTMRWGPAEPRDTRTARGPALPLLVCLQRPGEHGNRHEDREAVPDGRQLEAPDARPPALADWYALVVPAVDRGDLVLGVVWRGGQELVGLGDGGSQQLVRGALRLQWRGDRDDAVDGGPGGQQVDGSGATGAGADDVERAGRQGVDIAHEGGLLLAQVVGTAAPAEAKDMRLVTKQSPQRQRQAVQPGAVAESRDEEKVISSHVRFP